MIQYGMYDIFFKIFMYTLVTVIVMLSITLVCLVLLQRGEGAFSQPTTLYSTTVENSILKKNTIIVIFLLISMVMILNPILYKTHKSTINNIEVFESAIMDNNNKNIRNK